MGYLCFFYLLHDNVLKYCKTVFTALKCVPALPTTSVISVFPVTVSVKVINF